MATMRVAVLGPGSVGGLIAAVLARKGVPVTCIASDSSAQEIAKVGLSVISERFGTFSIPIHAANRLNEPVDVLAVTVKSTSLDDAISRVPSNVLGTAMVVPLLNGVEHVALLRQRLPNAYVIPATIRIETARTAPTIIEQRSPFAAIEIARGHRGDHRVADFAQTLGEIGFDVTIRDDEKEMLWEKLAILAPFALLTTIYSAPAGIIRSRHRPELEEVAGEIALVTGAEDVTIDPSSILAFFDRVPASMKSSMQLDDEAKRPLEIEAIGGAVLRSASTHAVPVPTIERLVSELRNR